MPWPRAADRDHRVDPSPQIDNRALRELNPVSASEHLQEVIELEKIKQLCDRIRSEAQFQAILAQTHPHLRRDCERQMRPFLTFPGADTSIEGL